MIDLEKYNPSDADAWTWNRATLNDVSDILAMAQSYFDIENNNVLTIDPTIYAKNITLAIVEQAYNVSKCQLICARDKTTNRLLSYAWLNRGHHFKYAREESAIAEIVHMDLALPIKQRIALLAQVLFHWQLWCRVFNIPFLVCSTIREDQKGFLRIHELAGFSIRGSFAYKKITNE